MAPNMELEFAAYTTFAQLIQITAAAACFIYWKIVKEGASLSKFCLIQTLSLEVKLYDAPARTRGRN